MAPQTAYNFYQSVPFTGALYDLESNQNVRSYVNAEASAAMPFGIGVAQGATDDAAILMVDTNSKIIGVTVHQHAVDPYQLPSSPAGAGIAAKMTAGVLRQGRIWAKVDAAVVPQDDVFARYTTTTAPKDQLGVLGPSADTSTAKQIVAAKFLSTAAAAAVAITEVNMP